jgi:uncharacterized RDD family membrane protein YckC
VNRVGFWRRTFAALIDWICAAIVLLPTEGVRQSLAASGDLSLFANQGILLGEHVFLLALFGFEVLTASSVGKFLLRQRIAKYDGSEASTATLLNRWTAKWSFILVALVYDIAPNTLLMWLANIAFFFVLIGCFAVAGESKLAWHDQWAGTAVYQFQKRRRAGRGFEIVQSDQASSDTSA